ncbi:glycosyltransferase family 4 protein [Polynucleobacter arcticus]|uniref:Glycosyl transferase family 1 n=1 Tax=Polynucleobacter arcticus TaxID=1743165 RepID=A0A6M9PBW6_9BURK|nr:glycosyltransferase family 4 protein [Polynucleobacter arcticus]QKM60200.1 glycosyl transferase family 1 [Polynucleobacter arcticus]
MSRAPGAGSNAFVFAYPGDLQTLTGGYIYDSHIVSELTALGWEVELLSLGSGFPFPDQETINQAEQLLCQVQAGKPIVIDGLALGVMPQSIAQAAVNHPIIALIHHPLAYESGLTKGQQVQLQESETLALSHVKQVIANSPMTAQALVDSFGVERKKISTVIPGTNRVSSPLYQVRTQFTSQDPFQWLSVGSIIPRKGFGILIEALAPLRDLPWSLSIVGDTSRDAKAYADLLHSIAHFDLQDRIEIHGAVDPAYLDSLYRNADGFVLASLFEGYGMAYAEALSYALPIIGTSGGAISQTVPDSAGILIPPGDVPSLTEALRLVINDPGRRKSLSSGAGDAAKKLPTWPESAKTFADIVQAYMN